MTKTYLCAKGALAALALGVSALSFAGNIPQYKFKKGGTQYTEFSDGTPIVCTWTTGTKTIFPGGIETTNTRSGEGFPIGFNFKFGGRYFDQFAISTAGELFLGKGIVNYGGDAFRLGMTPIKFGLSKADISYKTTGEEGNRILQVQLKKCVIAETGSAYKGQYSIQIRLYETDGKVEIALHELETTYSTSMGFDAGIHGWDGNDALQLTSDGLDNIYHISTALKADMLNPDSYIAWDSEDYDNNYKIAFTLTPESNATAPTDSPAGLAVEQVADRLNISCQRAAGADATVILVSEAPFTDEDLPVDGETFPAAYRDSSGKQYYPSIFGNAKALYYGNADNINVSLDDLKDGTTYYVKALSVNGYPAYGRNNSSDITFATSQAAPSAIAASQVNAKSIEVDVTADFPIIVAATQEGNPGWQTGYEGVFGTPAADVKPGDEIPGGGIVVYTGAPGKFTLSSNLNELSYLRAWTVNEGRVSSTSADLPVIPTPSLPFSQDIENWPRGEKLVFWESSENQFEPRQRDYDKQRAIYAVSTGNEEVRLTLPALNLNSETILSFEFAMETARAASSSEDGGVDIPQGSDPGTFGETGYLSIFANDTHVKDIKSYSGTMVGSGDGTNEDGSSTFESVEVILPATGKDSHVTLAFATPGFTKLYLRKIKVERSGEAPALAAPGYISANATDNSLLIYTDLAEDAFGTILILTADGAFTGELEDGKQYKAGDEIGNGRVIYRGEDAHVSTAAEGLTPSSEYTVTGYSYDHLDNYSKVSVHQTVATTGIEEISLDTVDFANAEVFTVDGIRLNVKSAAELPKGIYIINGRKVTVR